MKASQGKNSASIEDYEITVQAVRLSNHSSDIWSLGIILLEIFLSLYMHKKDCREMVHNLYLNKMTYQSRCIILNEILEHKKNPIFCSLIKEMLRDEAQMADSEYFFEEENFYEELVSKTSKKS
jgi:serine/threonine protein kinase